MNEILFRAILILDALLYFLSSALNGEGLKKRVKGRYTERIVCLSAVILNAGIVVWNVAANIRENDVLYAPFVSMFQVLIFLALCFFPLWLFIEKVCLCRGYKKYFLVVPGIVMLGPSFMDIADVWTFPPALQSVFFVPHIVCYMFSYTLAAAAAFIMITAYIKDENHDRVCMYCVRTLFPFMTAGMFLGAVWADQVWGDFWAWDIKECWSLCTWLNYMLCLHLFRREKSKKYARILLISGLVLVIITFLFSNVLKVDSVHSYS